MSVLPETGGPVLTMPSAPRAFHVMAKPTGATCNLDCDYCFFLSKEMLYPGSRFRMAEELQETYLRQLLEAHRSVPEVVVAWQGGEPTLMGLDFFRRSVELIERLKRPGQQVLNTLQTNGTLLTDEWGEFLAAQQVPGRHLHRRPARDPRPYRVDKGGKPTFDRVMRGLDVLRRHKVDYNILTTVHAANQQRGREVYRFLRDECGAEFMQFIPIVERATPETLAAANVGWGDAGQAPAAVRPRRQPGHGPDGEPGGLRPVPHRHLRGLGPARHRDRLRPDVRHRARQLGRRARRDVRPREDLRRSSSRSSTTATCTRATTSSSRASSSATSASCR